MIDKIEDIEPPLAHLVPEGSGHIVLPFLSMAALAAIDWRLFLASLVTFPLSFIRCVQEVGYCFEENIR